MIFFAAPGFHLVDERAVELPPGYRLTSLIFLLLVSEAPPSGV